MLLLYEAFLPFTKIILSDGNSKQYISQNKKIKILVSCIYSSVFYLCVHQLLKQKLALILHPSL